MTIGTMDHMRDLLRVALHAIRQNKVTGLGREGELGSWADEAARACDANLQPATRMLEGHHCGKCDRAIGAAQWESMRRLAFTGRSGSPGEPLTFWEIRECVCTMPIARPVKLQVLP